MSYFEIFSLCEYYFGDDWWHPETELFYPEFIEALLPKTDAFYYMSQLKYEQRHSLLELAMSPVYGFFVNIAKPHRYMELMASAFFLEECQLRYHNLPIEQRLALDKLELEAHETFLKPKRLAKRIGKKIPSPISEYANYIWYYHITSL